MPYADPEHRRAQQRALWQRNKQKHKCACGAPCSRPGGRCKACFTSGPKREHGPARRTYTFQQRQAALAVAHKEGLYAASRRFGIAMRTLKDWRDTTRALAYSDRADLDTPTERSLLLEHLIREQEMEMRFQAQQTYQHEEVEVTFGGSLDKPVTEDTQAGLHEFVALDGQGIAVSLRHLTEWLDPTHDEVVRELGEAA